MSGVEQLEDVVQDDRFVEVDLLLRRGHHLGRKNHGLYAFVLKSLEPLEGLCERYGARLIHRTDGYFFLVPSSDRLSRRQLTTGEMLVGQTLALLYQGPATLESAGVVDRSAVLRRLDRHVTGLEGDNGAGRTSAMIGAYVVLMPDLTRLRFTSLGETGATGGKRGIWGRLGEPGRPTYALLALRIARGERLLRACTSSARASRRSSSRPSPSTAAATVSRSRTSCRATCSGTCGESAYPTDAIVT